jgi:hypothetical protein
MREYARGNTIWLTAIFKDKSGNLFDPSSTWGAIYDSSSSIVATISALSSVSIGEYEYPWQSTRSHASGVVAFEACGVSGANVYVSRQILFKLV